MKAMSSRGTNSSIVTVLVFVAIAAMFAAPVQAAKRGNKWIALRWRFESGERIEYMRTDTLSGDAEELVPSIERSGPATMTMRTNVRWDVVDVDREGTATVNMAVDEIRGNVEVMDERMDLRINASGIKIFAEGGIVYDSVRMGGSRHRLMDRILDTWMLSADTRWTDVFGKGLSARITKLGEFVMPELVARDIIDRRYIDCLKQVQVPERLLRPGDEWTAVYDFSPFGVRRTQFLFEGIEDFDGRRCAKLFTRSEQEYHVPPTFPGKDEGASLDVSGGGRGRGVTYWDVDRGRVVSWQSTFDTDYGLHWESGPGTNGSQPQAKDIRTTYNSKVELRLR